MSWRSNEWGVPNPNACALCDMDKHIHMQRHDNIMGWHSWVEPSDAQRLDRMKKRRQAMSKG